MIQDIPGPAEEGVTARIARFVTETKDVTPPVSARTIAQLSVFDWSVVALAGRDEPVSTILRDETSGEGGRGEATLLGVEKRVPARAAALANGTAGHALDYDDTHFGHIGHVTAAVFPAALAVAEKTDAGGGALIDAFLIGAEAACRIGRYLGPAHYRAGFHQTATSGTFGATAAAARLLGLDVERTQHALGLASTMASGLKSQFGTMGKPLHAGLAASNGVEAAHLAARGFVSRTDGIESDQGFAATHAGEAETQALADLGQRWSFETVTYKFHACCHGTHAMLEAIRTARENERIDPHLVNSIRVRTHPHWRQVCDIERPRSGLEAKFSFRLTAAMALLGRDTAGLAAFSAETCTDPALIELRDKVVIEPVDEYSDTEASVLLAMSYGRTIERHHDLAAPLEADVKEQRLRAKAARLIGQRNSDAVWQTILALRQTKARELAQCLNDGAATLTRG